MRVEVYRATSNRRARGLQADGIYEIAALESTRLDATDLRTSLSLEHSSRPEWSMVHLLLTDC
jgi:hypothetical protein